MFVQYLEALAYNFKFRKKGKAFIGFFVITIFTILFCIVQPICDLINLTIDEANDWLDS